MIPKVDIVMVSIDTTYEEFLDIVKENKFTRMPVYKDSSDNIVGIVNIKDLKCLKYIKMQEYLQKIWNTDQNFNKCFKI